MEEISQVLRRDLSAASGSTVEVILYEIEEYNGFKPIAEPDAICLDKRPVSIESYEPDSSTLEAIHQLKWMKPMFHLLRPTAR